MLLWYSRAILGQVNPLVWELVGKADWTALGSYVLIILATIEGCEGAIGGRGFLPTASCT